MKSSSYPVTTNALAAKIDTWMSMGISSLPVPMNLDTNGTGVEILSLNFDENNDNHYRFYMGNRHG